MIRMVFSSKTANNNNINSDIIMVASTITSATATQIPIKTKYNMLGKASYSNKCINCG